MSYEISKCPNCQTIMTPNSITSMKTHHMPSIDENNTDHMHNYNSLIGYYTCVNCGRRWSSKIRHTCWCGRMKFSKHDYEQCTELLDHIDYVTNDNSYRLLKCSCVVNVNAPATIENIYESEGRAHFIKENGLIYTDQYIRSHIGEELYFKVRWIEALRLHADTGTQCILS